MKRQEFLADGQLCILPWDLANNMPIYTPPPPVNEYRFYERYLRFVASMLCNRVVWWIVFCLALALGFLKAMGNRTDVEIPGATLSIYLVAALWVGSCQGSAIKRDERIRGNDIRWNEAIRSQAKTSAETFKHLDFGGRTLPFGGSLLPQPNSSSGIAPLYGNYGFSNFAVGNIVWVPILAFAHLLLFISLMAIVRGAHFMLVPVPPNRELLTRASRGKALPEWAGQNWIQHLAAREARVRNAIAEAKAEKQRRIMAAEREPR